MDSFEDDEKVRSKREAERRLAQRQRREDLQAVMQLPAGRRMLYRLINEDCGLCSASYAGQMSHETAYLEGRRSMGITLNNELLRDSPTSYLLMLQEHLEALPEPEPDPDEAF